jgi:hypothetical protein
MILKYWKILPPLKIQTWQGIIWRLPPTIRRKYVKRNAENAAKQKMKLGSPGVVINIEKPFPFFMLCSDARGRLQAGKTKPDDNRARQYQFTNNHRH